MGFNFECLLIIIICNNQLLNWYLIFTYLYYWNYLHSFTWDFRTDIPEDELDEIISGIQTQFNSSAPAGSASSAPAGSTASASADHSSAVFITPVEDRKLRNLRKKLDQIEELKERQLRGDTLEANQVWTVSYFSATN